MKKRIDKTSNALKKKILGISSMVYAIIIMISITCIALSLLSLSNSIKANDLENSESGVATFDYYKITRHLINNSVIDVQIYLENGDVLVIDSEDYSTKLETALADLEKGQEIHFVLNTESGYLIKLTSDTSIYEKGGKQIPIPVCIFLLIFSLSSATVSIIALVSQSIEKKKLSAFINQKNAEFNKYSYEIATIFEESCWVVVACNEVDAVEDGGAEVFANLLKRIAVKINKGYWEGAFSQVGEQRYIIKNDPLSLVYQYDSLLGIVIEYKKDTSKDALMRFLLDVAQIHCDVK